MLTTKQEYQIKKLIETQRFTKEEIAMILGCGVSTIYAYSKKMNMRIPTKKALFRNDVRAKVIDLLDGNILTSKEIATTLGISVYDIKRIAFKGDYDLQQRNFKRKNDETLTSTQHIADFIVANPKITYKEIAKKYKINVSRIKWLMGLHGIRRYEKYSEEHWTNTNVKINKDIKDGMPYADLVVKYNLNEGKIRQRLYKNGLKLLTKTYQSARDIEIASQYKTKIARKVMVSPITSLDSPTRIKSLSRIYGVACQDGFKRYPNIGDRSKGGTFEDKKILRYIQKKKDKDGWSFQKISDKLNRLGHKTLTGKEFSMANVVYKYHAYQKNKRKRLTY